MVTRDRERRKEVLDEGNLKVHTFSNKISKHYRDVMYNLINMINTVACYI